jgi:phosphatidylglycerophosphatase A
LIARLIATWFYCGYTPKAPGTAGSIAAIIIAVAVHRYIDAPGSAFGILAVLIAMPGIWAADVVAQQSGTHDPQIVVVDEVVGQWVTLAGATQLNWKSWLIALVLFRLFDMWKPWPIRKLEKLPGGVGIVVDDVLAGVYAAVVLFAAGWFHLY